MNIENVSILEGSYTNSEYISNIWRGIWQSNTNTKFFALEVSKYQYKYFFQIVSDN